MSGSVGMQVATPLYPPLSGGQASTPQNRTYRVWVDDVWLMPYKLLEMVLQTRMTNFIIT